LDQVAYDLAMFVLQDGMTCAAIGINEYRVRAVEGVRHVGPAVGVNDRSDAGHLVEAFLEEQTAGAKFVVARTVAWMACDEQDFLRRGGAIRKRRSCAGLGRRLN